MDQVTSRDGTMIGFWRSGAGPALLLVHGTTADHSRWAAVSPLLERHFSVYAMDRRGRGASDDIAPYDLMREAEDVGAVVEGVAETAGEPVFVLGHSYGAVCSLEASLLTDKIRRLILYEPPIPTGLPMYPVGLPEEMQALVDQGELEPALELFFREVVRMPEQELAAFRQLPVWQQRIRLAPTIPREMTIDQTYHFDAERYTNQRVPTLLLLGSESPPMFRQAVEIVASALANSQVVILQGQRHVAMDVDPDPFVGEVRRFLLT